MKKTIKWFVSAILAVSVVLTLAACGGSENRTVVNTGDEQTSNETQNETQNEDVSDSKYYAYDKVNITANGVAMGCVEYAYDSEGRLLKQVTEDLTSEEKESFEFTYDENGNVLKAVFLTTYGEKNEYVYENGILKECFCRDEDGSVTVIKYSYNNSGKLETEECRNADGDLLYVTEYKYDDNGWLLEECQTDSDGDQVYKDEYSYNSYGKLLSLTEYAGDELYKCTMYTYDKGVNLIGKTVTDDGVSVSFLAEYVYDGNGNLVKIICRDEGGNITGTLEYTYDDAGNMVKESYPSDSADITVTYDSNGNKIKLEMIDDEASFVADYTYDSKGNLVKISLSNGSETQNIEYEYTGEHLFNGTPDTPELLSLAEIDLFNLIETEQPDIS